MILRIRLIHWGLVVLITVITSVALRLKSPDPLPFELSWDPQQVAWAIVLKVEGGHIFRTDPLVRLRQLERELQDLIDVASLQIETITNTAFRETPNGPVIPLIPEPVPIGVGMLSAIADRANQQPEVIERLLSSDWHYVSLLISGAAPESLSVSQRERLKTLLHTPTWSAQWVCRQPNQCELITHNEPNREVPNPQSQP